MNCIDNLLIRDHRSSDGAEEDRVGGEVCGEIGSRSQELPWADNNTDNGANIATPSNGKESWHQGSQIGTRRDGVGSNVGTELGKDESGGNQEGSGTLASTTDAVDLVVGDETLEEIERIPGCSDAGENDCRGGSDNDSDERSQTETHWDSD